jgi:hypothetical protein
MQWWQGTHLTWHFDYYMTLMCWILHLKYLLMHAASSGEQRGRERERPRLQGQGSLNSQAKQGALCTGDSDGGRSEPADTTPWPRPPIQFT